ERYEIEVIRRLLQRAADTGVLVVDDLDMLAHVLFGAVSAGVLGMVRSHEPSIERQRFRTVMLAVMAGLVRRDRTVRDRNLSQGQPGKDWDVGESP
ncbi:MAG: hypothetical protein ABSE84_31825, partial [Isosphaeraceae bacterium]